ncbi:MAG: sporulation protein [Gammaproteobacteria bacterium]|nr:MAG: sporulation protein [Gammaproteobacteria bacterium]
MDGLKQRIIGALVLVSLAVIFVPMVFDEPHSERTSTTIKIPEEPPFPEVTAPESRAVTPPDYEESSASASAGAVDSPAPQDTSDDAPGYRLVEEADSEPAPQPSTSDTTAKTTPPPEVVEKEAEPQQDPAVKPKEYTRSLEGAWVVQLGSFGNSDNAKRLRDGVREKGYGAHLQQVERGDSVLTRVFSGPFASKGDAESAKKVLDTAFGLNSLVTTGDK